MPIQFYFENDPTGALANSSRHSIRFVGKIWPTAEHLFHAMKFHSRPDLQEQIRACPTAEDVKRLSISLNAHTPLHWGGIRVAVMTLVLYEKFVQNADARQALLATGDEELIEQIPDDYPWDNQPNTFWGRLSDGVGENRLGQILMSIRETLRKS